MELGHHSHLDFEREVILQMGSVFLQVDLMFSDMNAYGGAERFADTGAHFDAAKVNTFKSVSCNCFKLHLLPENGIVLHVAFHTDLQFS